MTGHAIIGIVAGILSFVPCPIYIRSILKGNTKPDRVTWWILALVSGMITASYWASGASETMWFPIGYTLSFTTIAIFSLKYGEGPMRLHTLDRACLLLALLSAIVWWSLSAPVIALFMNICTEFIGLIPTMVKAYQRPWTENKTAWVITTVASLLNIFAVGEWTLVIALYPVYTFVTNAITTSFLFRKRLASL